MRYFDLSDDTGALHRWHIGEVRDETGHEPRLKSGSHMATTGPLLAKVHYDGPALEFCLTSLSVPVTTKRLAAVMVNLAGGDLQVIPLQVITPRASSVERVVLNAIRKIRCLDEDRSKFTKWTVNDHRADLAGQYRQVTKLVVNPTAIPPDVHIFRIEGWEVALIVSETLKNAMEQAGCHGAVFQDVTPPLH
ncbi:MAG: hypothetical protein IPK82_17955 [Polyangiaceae bacterium]|nr:hypothetical protein [Polyangiaceae bacterium]